MQAASLTKEICKNLEAAAKQVAGTSYTVVLRGDSTLRGHFPEVRDFHPFKIHPSIIYVFFYFLE